MVSDRETVSDLLAKWQDILRLSDWDIRFEIVRTRWRKRGDIKIDQCNKSAVLMIHQAADAAHVEEIVIHELMHLRLWGLDQMLEDLFSALYGSDDEDPRKSFAYTQFMKILEATAQDITKALLTVAGKAPGLAFSRLSKEVEAELNAK